MRAALALAVVLLAGSVHAEDIITPKQAKAMSDQQMRDPVTSPAVNLIDRLGPVLNDIETNPRYAHLRSELQNPNLSGQDIAKLLADEYFVHPGETAKQHADRVKAAQAATASLEAEARDNAAAIQKDWQHPMQSSHYAEMTIGKPVLLDQPQSDLTARLAGSNSAAVKIAASNAAMMRARTMRNQRSEEPNMFDSSACKSSEGAC